MTYNPEKEVTRVWKSLQAAQRDIPTVWYRWRKAALELLGPNVDPMQAGMKAAEVYGDELGHSFLARLNWLKGEEGFVKGLCGNIMGEWTKQGALLTVRPGDNPYEAYIVWTRCPWPTFCSQYGVDMEEDVLTCDAILQNLLVPVNKFFGVNYQIETLKAIPRGQGECLRRLYKAD
jgi:hypothetical protein